MTNRHAIVDGVAMPLAEVTVPYADPAVTLGWSVFETLRSEAGVPRQLELHLERLAASAEAARIRMPPAGTLADEVRRLAAGLPGTGRLRITLTGGGMRIVTGEPLDPTLLHRPVRAVRGPHRDEPFLGGEVKHGSRAPWVVAVARAGVDEVLLVADGCFIEGTRSAVVAVIDGALWAHPEDGRILPSTTVADLVARAERLGVPVIRRPIPADGPWDGLYVASVLRDLAPVVQLDGAPLPGWDPIGRRLAGIEADNT